MKNYVIEFNKADLKPHLILEKDAKAAKQSKNNPQINNIYTSNNNNNNNNHIINNNLSNQELVRESNNFYYNEGKK